MVFYMPDRSSIAIGMNKLSTEKRCAVVSATIVGYITRGTARMTSVARNTDARLFDLG